MTPEAPPLVSIVVRSIGRPELATALASAAAQDHPALEILVIDATGGDHPPLPAMDLRPGHSISLVSTGRRLPRPHAANAGLDALRGEYFCFLDDDDAYEPRHVSTLLAAASAHPRMSCRLWSDKGAQSRRLGTAHVRAAVQSRTHVLRSAISPAGRADSNQGPRIGLPVRRGVRDLLGSGLPGAGGPAFQFSLCPRARIQLSSDLGTSGTGQQANRNVARFIVFESRLRAKWAGPLAFHNQRAGDGNRLAIASYASGDRRAAAAQFAQVLADYPDDPNALHGLARLALEAGDIEAGLEQVRRALAINADAAEFQLTYAELLAAHGRTDEAVEAACLALSDPSFLKAAKTFLDRYRATAPTPQGRQISRTAPCPCGSGRRFKHCHGAVAGAPIESAPKASHPLVATVRADLMRGETARATAHLEALRPGDLIDAEDARVAGSICNELGRTDLAIDFLSRSLELRDDRIVRQYLAQTCADHYQELSSASMEAGGGARRTLQVRLATVRVTCSPRMFPPLQDSRSALRAGRQTR